MNPVAIIGGGITGLTAAFRLMQNQVPVVVYEAGDRVGGPMQTIREGGYLTEYGPNTILETSSKITALINDLGLQERRRDSDSAMNKNYIVRRGKMRQLPQSPLRFAFSPLLSVPAKLRMVAEPLIRARAEDDDESLADFVLRHFGREFLDYVINPFVAGVYAGNPEDLSVRHAFPKLKELEEKYKSVILGAAFGGRDKKEDSEIPKSRAKKVSFDEGLQVLIDALQVQLRESISLHSHVVGLRQAGTEWTVICRGWGGEEERQHSAVLLAAPAYRIAEIEIEAEEEVDFSVMMEMVHPPVARVALGFRREDVADPLDGFGFLVPKVENRGILGTTFSSSIFENRAPEGHVLLTTFVGGCRQPELADQPTEKVFELVLNDLKEILGVRGEPTYRHHWLFPRAIPQYNVGHKKFIDFMKGTEGRLPGLYFAGSFRDGISVGNSIVSGHDAANRIAQFIATARPGRQPYSVSP